MEMGVSLVEEQARARQAGSTRSEMARATIFVGGMYCAKCSDAIRDSLSRVRGVVEVLVTNYVESPYGIVQVFYDSRQVRTDEFLAHLRTPYWATLIEDRDPKREQTLQRYTEIYVC
ncbi:hypothetical protein AUG19_07620 [archaeon 13_1_20CM_2_54_9]|nr:MAG: hypothetical protein AUJ07_09955 [Crenarchaeota archaeon 13_1_40CM_3_53_5]OLE74788.1 MAG: hypothetical protein AUG19_07620 [archaeon 13_1_20CM_2_54_9]